MNAKAKTSNVLEESAAMLREVNQALHARFHEIPDDVQALLVQKGSLMQCATRELGMLLDQASERVDQLEELLDHCERWREEFFLPLRLQCEGSKLEDPVETTDLDALISDLERMMVAAGRKKMSLSLDSSSDSAG